MYDIYCIKENVIGEDKVAVLSSMNNGFFKLPTNTAVKIDELVGEKSTVGLENRELNKHTLPVYRTELKTNYAMNRIVFRAPGTGKSFELENDRKAILKGGTRMSSEFRYCAESAKIRRFKA